MIIGRRSLLVLAATLWTACTFPTVQAEPPDFAHLDEARVEVTSGVRKHVFRAWVADTPESRSRGLMFVRELPPERAMLFLFEAPQFASFWMKNTYIPLDLLFIAPDGRIANIIENATPHSPTLLESTAPVMAVLEVAGGTTKRLRIRAGDRLEIVEPR